MVKRAPFKPKIGGANASQSQSSAASQSKDQASQSQEQESQLSQPQESQLPQSQGSNASATMETGSEALSQRQRDSEEPPAKKGPAAAAATAAEPASAPASYAGESSQSQPSASQVSEDSAASSQRSGLPSVAAKRRRPAPILQRPVGGPAAPAPKKPAAGITNPLLLAGGASAPTPGSEPASQQQQEGEGEGEGEESRATQASSQAEQDSQSSAVATPTASSAPGSLQSAVRTGSAPRSPVKISKRIANPLEMAEPFSQSGSKAPESVSSQRSNMFSPQSSQVSLPPQSSSASMPPPVSASASRGKPARTEDTAAGAGASVAGDELPPQTSTALVPSSGPKQVSGKRRVSRPRPKAGAVLPDEDHLTMRDLIFLNPTANPMSSSLQHNKGGRRKKPEGDASASASASASVSVSVSVSEAASTQAVGVSALASAPSQESTSAGPQLKMVNGRLVLDPDSLTVKATSMGPAPTPASGPDRPVTYSSFAKRKAGPRWTDEETEAFYSALSMCGSNFDLMARMYPGRNHRHLKNKYLTEDKKNHDKVSQALLKRVPLDWDFLNTPVCGAATPALASASSTRASAGASSVSASASSVSASASSVSVSASGASAGAAPLPVAREAPGHCPPPRVGNEEDEEDLPESGL